MRTHYKADVNYSDKALEIASDRVYYIYQVICLNSNILSRLDFKSEFSHLTYFRLISRILNLTF
jgi:hypothetical protein